MEFLALGPLRRQVLGAGGPVCANDPRYSDEEPRWSRDGSHILFCRLDVSTNGPATMTIWLMEKDGSGARQVAGPLEYSSDLWKGEKLVYYGYYGYPDWPGMFDWWHGG